MNGLVRATRTEDCMSMEPPAAGRLLPAPGSAGLRSLFPMLGSRATGAPLVYLDSAATAQKPLAVLEAGRRFETECNASAHRGLYGLAARATEAYEGCRARVAAFLGSSSPESVAITRGTTSALNLAAQGLALGPDAEILLTEMEHHSNLVPWLLAARRTGARLRHIPVLAGGTLDLEAFERLLGPKTRVVALAWVSNVLGTINPVERIAEAAHARGALVVVDAAQAVGRLPVRLAECGADLLAFSAHKCYGPMGLGFLAGARQALERIEPLEGGGGMIVRVDLDRADWAPVPRRFEAGTPNVAAAAAFPAALDLLAGLGLEAIRDHEQALSARLLEGLAARPGWELLGPRDPAARAGLASFHHPRIHAHDLATFLDAQGIAVRAGHHCAQPLHRKLGLEATVRASFGVYTSESDLDALLAGLDEAARFFLR